MAKKMSGIVISGNDMGVCPVEDVDYVMIAEKDSDKIGDLAVDGDTDALYDLAKGTIQVTALLKIAVAARDLVKTGPRAPGALEELQQAVTAAGSGIDLLPSA